MIKSFFQGCIFVIIGILLLAGFGLFSIIKQVSPSNSAPQTLELLEPTQSLPEGHEYAIGPYGGPYHITTGGGRFVATFTHDAALLNRVRVLNMTGEDIAFLERCETTKVGNRYSQILPEKSFLEEIGRRYSNEVIMLYLPNGNRVKDYIPWNSEPHPIQSYGSKYHSAIQSLSQAPQIPPYRPPVVIADAPFRPPTHSYPQAIPIAPRSPETHNP